MIKKNLIKKKPVAVKKLNVVKPKPAPKKEEDKANDSSNTTQKATNLPETKREEFPQETTKTELHPQEVVVKNALAKI